MHSHFGVFFELHGAFMFYPLYSINCRSSTPIDFGVVNGRETGNQRSASALQDEVSLTICG